MSNENQTPENSKPAPVKKVKKKGPIRWEAILPFVIVVGLTWVYFFFFFDLHLRKAMEYGGYQMLGAEVNVADVKTSFWNANIRIQNIQCTDPEKPNQNMIEIGDIRFGMLWDALLRAKIVVNEMAIEGIKVSTPRKAPGKVKPPEPIVESNGPSALEKEADRLKNQAIDSAKSQYSENVLGDIAAMLGGTSSDDQLKNIEGTLASKAQLDAFNKSYQEKAKAWDERIKALPKPKEIQELGARLNTIKAKDFKTPQELADSVKQFQDIINEADQKAKSVQNTSSDLNNDLKLFDQGLKELDVLVRKDIQDLEARFRLPKLDASAISKSIFRHYLDPYLNKISRYREMAEKYIPPNLTKKGSDDPNPAIQPRPRTEGISYEFGRPNSYPLFWAKKINVQSQAGATPESGTVEGTITDVTTNQILTGKPTVARLRGDFPSDGIEKFLAQISLDNTKELSLIVFDLAIGSYPVKGREVVNSPEVKLNFQDATGILQSKGTLTGLRDLKFNLSNQLQKVTYDIQAQNPTVQEILKGVFAGIPTVTIDADIEGRLPEVKIDVASNLGPEIKKGFEAQIQKKIEEARAKIQAYVNDMVGKEKAKLETEVNKLKGQGETEIKKVEAQLNAQKAEGQAKIDESKKQFENQAKAGIQKEAEKAVDDIKKKFGF